ncbi:MAG: hypothetical protein IJM37_09630 [Lachnospiraceae bacterium]|nr:hypothetical protein [Lachnospiraceae bacterium]
MRKTSNLLISFLILLLLLLGAAVVYMYFMSDRQKPVISIDEKYLEQCDLNDREAVLKAASALDNKTENVEVVLTDIILLSDNVYRIKYMAKDDAGNIAIATASVKKTAEDSGALESVETTEGDEQSLPEEQEIVTQSAENETQEQPVETEAQPVEVETQEPADAGTASEAPVITLTTHNVNIPVGTRFNYLNYIDDITDDKDDSETLNRRIRLDGGYDTGVAGTYEVIYFVVDTDGNRSNREVLTLVVE